MTTITTTATSAATSTKAARWGALYDGQQRKISCSLPATERAVLGRATTNAPESGASPQAPPSPTCIVCPGRLADHQLGKGHVAGVVGPIVREARGTKVAYDLCERASERALIRWFLFILGG